MLVGFTDDVAKFHIIVKKYFFAYTRDGFIKFVHFLAATIFIVFNIACRCTLTN